MFVLLVSFCMKCYLGMARRVIKLDLKDILYDVFNDFIMGFTSRTQGMHESTGNFLAT
jgi:hypothetical protein